MMIELMFTKLELELVADALLTILTYNDQGRLPPKYKDNDIATLEDARRVIVEVLE